MFIYFQHDRDFYQLSDAAAVFKTKKRKTCLSPHPLKLNK